MLGIVVVSFGSHTLLESHLAAVDLSALDVRVVVVDNFRSMPAQEAVRTCADAHGWEFLANPTNRGFGSGMNLGVARALELGCSTLILLNPDVRITAPVLAALVDQTENSPRTLVTPRIVRPDGTPWFTGGRIDLVAARTRNVEDPGSPRTDGWLTGACLAVHADLWREVGGFDDDYFLYWEDIDLSHRCTRLGAELLVRQDLEVVHDVGGTQGAPGAAKSSAYYFYNCRNRLLFAAKNLPRRHVLRWLVRTPGYARLVLLRGGRRQLLRTWRPVSAVACGSVVGASHALRVVARGHA